jgi:flagellar motor switch protein FliG
VIADFEAITAPIVVGTSKALARSIKKTKPSIREKILQNVSCVVCDEIDRLVDTLSKYATRREVSYAI